MNIFLENNLITWGICFILGLILGLYAYLKDRGKLKRNRKYLKHFMKGLILSYLICLIVPFVLSGAKTADNKTIWIILLGLILFSLAYLAIAKILFLILNLFLKKKNV